MAILNHAINIQDLPVDESMGDFKPLPDGEYVCIIKKAEIKEGKNEGSSYFNLQLKVVEGKYHKRVLFGMVTYTNSSDKAEAIGQAQLRTILESCGIPTLTDTDQLIGGTVIVRVETEEYQGEPKNVIKGWDSVGGVAVPSMPSQSTTTAATPADTGKKAPPWAQRK